MIDCEKCTKIEEFTQKTGRLHPAYVPKICLDCLVSEINKIKPLDLSKIEKDINSLRRKITKEIESLKSRIDSLEEKIKKSELSSE